MVLSKNNLVVIAVLSASAISQLIMNISLGFAVPLNPGNPFGSAVEQNQSRKTPQEHRVRIQSALQEHSSAASSMYINFYNNRPELLASEQAVTLSNRVLIDEVRELYGPEVAEDFEILWNSRVMLLTSYTESYKLDNQTKLEKIDNALDEFAHLSSQVVTIKSGHIPKAEVQKTFKQQVELEKAVIQAHAAGDHRSEYLHRHLALENSRVLAEQLIENSPVMSGLY